MTVRELVCACEDVTAHDIHEAIAAGNTDMESVKRFTGLATGICQGRSCMAATARILAAHGTDSTTLRPTTPRPPLWPTPLGVLAAGGPLPAMYPGPAAPALSGAPPMPRVPHALPPLPERAQIVIIGGGIMGLSVAYHLALCGLRDVVVLERSYLNAGASGRNGGGVRCQFSTETNVRLMQESLAMCRDFAHELGINIWLRQGGYLFLAQTPAHLATLEKHIALQNRLGVPTRLVSPAEAGRLAPHLAVDDIRGAAFNPDDGVIFPWPFLWGYADRARALGVHVATFTPATELEVAAGRIVAVQTPRGRIACDLVINAAAAWAKEIAAQVGVALPNKPERHEILVTESFKPFLGPLVTEMGTGLYFSQSMRGELVAGLGDPEQPEGVEMRSSLRYLTRASRALVARMPILAGVKVVRQWAGCYDVTPDGNPIVGEVEGVGGFFQLNGFVGHGFMMAPAVGKRVAAYLAQGKNDPWLTQNRLARFAHPETLERETMIIG